MERWTWEESTRIQFSHLSQHFHLPEADQSPKMPIYFLNFKANTNLIYIMSHWMFFSAVQSANSPMVIQTPIFLFNSQFNRY
jgi:hypothetical protein